MFHIAKKKAERLENNVVTDYTSPLWQNNKVKSSLEPFCSSHCEKIELQNGFMMGASTRGKKHRHEARNNDDWFELDTIGQWCLIAVSDGAGSKLFSRIGAKESCRSAIRFMKRSLEEVLSQFENLQQRLEKEQTDSEFISACSLLANIVQKAMKEGFRGVKNAYEARRGKTEYEKEAGREIKISDFDCTLLIGILIPVVVNGNDEHIAVFSQIGDGLILSISDKEEFDQAVRILGYADGGRFSGETLFLSEKEVALSEGLMKRTRVSRRKISHIMVMTDGVSDDYIGEYGEILRLYMDLYFNGVLKHNDDEKLKNNTMPASLSVEPTPSDCSKSVFELQYSKRIQKLEGLDISALWQNKNKIIKTNKLKYEDKLLFNKKSEDALLLWLRHYVERGSFDDRTLVIFANQK